MSEQNRHAQQRKVIEIQVWARYQSERETRGDTQIERRSPGLETATPERPNDTEHEHSGDHPANHARRGRRDTAEQEKTNLRRAVEPGARVVRRPQRERDLL